MSNQGKSQQVSRPWNLKLTTVLLSFGFTQSHLEYSLFIRHLHGKMVIVLVYVDDLIITSDDLYMI